MTIADSISAASNATRKLWERHGIRHPLRFLGFCMSLLPVPAIAQVGQMLDRHLSDKAFEREVNEIWSQIEALNSRVTGISTLEAAIQEVARTVASDESLSAKVKEFIAGLRPDASEFSVITEDGSYQQILNSVISADVSHFIAKSGSTNFLSGVTVKSSKTTLHASGNSKNFVDNTNFQGPSGTTGMKRITATGSVQVADASVGFGPGGAIGLGVGGVVAFGPSPFEMRSVCPKCQHTITADKRVLAKFTSVQCPNCKAVIGYDPKSLG
jgi:hypothetical protein